MRAITEDRAQDRSISTVRKLAFVVAAFDADTTDVDFLPYHPFVHYSFGSKERSGDYRVFVYNGQESTFEVLEEVFKNRGDAKRRALIEHCKKWRELYDEDYSDEHVLYDSGPDNLEEPTRRLYRWWARKVAGRSCPWKVKSSLPSSPVSIRRSKPYQWCISNIGPVKVKRNWTFFDSGKGWAYVEDDFYFKDQTHATAFKLMFGAAQ